MPGTHTEYVGEGYSVTIQHCSVCNVHLGTNYPSDRCNEHKNSVRSICGAIREVGQPCPCGDCPDSL